MLVAIIKKEEFEEIKNDLLGSPEFLNDRLEAAGFDLNKEYEEEWDASRDCWLYTQDTNNDLDPELTWKEILETSASPTEAISRARDCGLQLSEITGNAMPADEQVAVQIANSPDGEIFGVQNESLLRRVESIGYNSIPADEPMSRSRARERQWAERPRGVIARNTALQPIGRVVEPTPELPPVEHIPKRAITLE